MYKFLITQKLTQDEIENQKSSISIKKLNSSSKSFSQSTPGLDAFTEELCQTSNEYVIAVLSKLFQKIEKGTFSNLFYKAS